MLIPLNKPINEKFKEVILYILSKCNKNKTFGKTVLYKLLYFSDFNYYQLHYESITGQKYRKIENGPAPMDFDIAMHQLQKEGKIKVTAPKEDYEQYLFSLEKVPEIKSLSEEEIRLIDKVCSNLGKLNAKEISRISHQDMPWEATKPNQFIDYDLVFYREEGISRLFE